MSASAERLSNPEVRDGKYTATQKHIRGSSILLAGRFLSLAANFAIQVLTVRALSKSDYGAFAYALAVVSFGSNLTVVGLDKTISRFVPIYQEQKDYNRMFGTIMMMIGTIIALGIALVLVITGMSELLTDSLIKDKNVVALIIVMIALAPLQAMDSLFGSMLAIFAGPRAIFFRRYLLNPGLKLLVVLLVLFVGGDVLLMANGYLLAGALAVVVYAMMIWHVIQTQGLFKHFSLGSITMPFRQIFGFSLPLLTTDLVYMLRNFMVVAVLQYFHTASDVAAFRAVLPVAGLNMFVYESFTFLYMPTASRMFARREWSGINDLYWQSATWIAIATFPVFVLTFALAEPLTLLLFGERYSQSAIVLAILAVGHFVNAALGFNTFTLRVYGKVRRIVIIDIAAGIISLVACLVLVPYYGVLGAAIAVTLTLIVHNLLNQAGLAATTDIHLFEWRYLRVYVSLLAAGLALLLLQVMLKPPVYISVGAAAIVSVALFLFNRTVLNVPQMFPELLRLPFVGRLFGRPKPRVPVEEQAPEDQA